MIVTSLSALAESVRSTLTSARSNPATPSPAGTSTDRAPVIDSVTISARARAHRLEDLFAPVDRNHDGAIETNELISALPKPAQRPEQRQSFSPTYTVTGSRTPS